VVELIYLWASSTRFGTFLTNSQKILLKRGGTQTDAQKNTAQTGWYALLIFQCEFNAIWYIFDQLPENTGISGWYALLIFQCEFNAIWYIFAGQLI
jgi:hypothetical protein